MAERDPRSLVIDPKGIAWAFNMGREAYSRAQHAPNVRWDRFCPFREGSPHRGHWREGWNAGRHNAFGVPR